MDETNEDVELVNPEIAPEGVPKKKRSVRRRYDEIKRLKKLQAIIKHPTLTEAYMEINPKSSPKSARTNSSKLLTPEIFEDVKRLLSMGDAIKANKDVLEKVLFMVVARWMKEDEKTGDMIAAVRELTKLVPEFKDKIQTEDISSASEQELDRKLRSFGYDPKSLGNSCN